MAGTRPSLPLTIFAHKGCWDAFVSVWIVMRQLPRHYHALSWAPYTARPAGQPQPPIIVHFLAPHQTRARDVPLHVYRNRHVIFLDLMPHEDWLNGLLRDAARPAMLLIDHHECAHVAQVARTLGHKMVHSTDHAACELTWAHFYEPWQPAPWFIKYFAAADMFRFDDPAVPSAREVSLALSTGSQHYALEWLNHLFRHAPDRLFALLVEQGSLIHLQQLQRCQQLLPSVQRGMVPLLPGPRPTLDAFVLPYHGKDLCMGLMAQQVARAFHVADMVLVLYQYRRRPNQTRVWLRATGDTVNVAEVVRCLPGFESGGGHRRAAAAWLNGDLTWYPVPA